MKHIIQAGLLSGALCVTLSNGAPATARHIMALLLQRVGRETSHCRAIT